MNVGADAVRIHWCSLETLNASSYASLTMRFSPDGYGCYCHVSEWLWPAFTGVQSIPYPVCSFMSECRKEVSLILEAGGNEWNYHHWFGSYARCGSKYVISWNTMTFQIFGIITSAIYLSVTDILETGLFVTHKDTAVTHHSFNIRSFQDAAFFLSSHMFQISYLTFILFLCLYLVFKFTYYTTYMYARTCVMHTCVYCMCGGGGGGPDRGIGHTFTPCSH
jgi:hypothetical protein